MVKVFNMKVKGSMEALHREIKHMGAKPPVSTVVPALISCGVFPATAVPCLVMSYCGEQLQLTGGKIASGLRKAVKVAIRKFHYDSTCCHHDLHPGNLVLDSTGAVKVVDLASMAAATTAERTAELQAFCREYM